MAKGKGKPRLIRYNTQAAGASAGASCSLPALALLPALVLTGRWYLNCSCTLLGAQHVLQLQEAADQLQAKESMYNACAHCSLHRHPTASCGALLGWLQQPEVAQQLESAGNTVQPLLQQLQDLQAGWAQVQAVQAVASTAGTFPLLSVLASQLEKCGTALTAVGVSCCCNNPDCNHVDDHSELGMVVPRGLCAGCKVARYCSQDCQGQHWKHHKSVCKASRSAATAAAAP